MSTATNKARQLTAKWYYKENWGWDIDEALIDIERKAFHNAILVCANGDGALAPEERQWVIGRAATVGASEEQIAELEAYPGTEDINQVVESTLATSRSRRAAVYFAIRAASADGEYHPEEKKTILAMAKTLGIEESIVAELENLVEEEDRIKAARIRLCFPDGNPFGN